MSDDVSQSDPPPEPTPTPQPAEPVAVDPAPAPAPEPVAPEVVSPMAEVPEALPIPPATPRSELSSTTGEVVEQTSDMVTEAVQDVVQARLAQQTEPAPREVTPSTTAELPTRQAPQVPNSAVSPPESAAAASPLPPSQSFAPHQSAGSHMREVVRARKQARLEKIMEMAIQKRVIVNDDVEKLLKVSDATATRYLSELVKTGRLKRSGAKYHERYEPLGGSNSAT